MTDHKANYKAFAEAIKHIGTSSDELVLACGELRKIGGDPDFVITLEYATNTINMMVDMVIDMKDTIDEMQTHYMDAHEEVDFYE